MAHGRQPSSLSSIVLGVLLVSLLASCNAQGVSVRYQNQFQCWPGVDVAGIPMPFNTRIPATSPDDCASKCLSSQGCTAFTLTRSLWCNLKFLPFDSIYGSTLRDSTVMTSCILKTVGGSLPSPPNTMCYTGQDVAGNLIANTGAVTSSPACASLCVATPGCSYSVFRAGGADGLSAPVCSLKSNAFAGVEPTSITRRDPLVTGICFRAIPAPEVQDPLLIVAGPIPFLISTQLTNKCLRAPSPPYYPGQPVTFSSDCSGAEPLWTYNAGTQIITHYPSGLCLAPGNSYSGASVVLSDNCGATSGNQIVSRGSSSLLVLLGNRWLLPANAMATDGAAMVAVCNGLQPYNYITAAAQAYQCFSGVDIPGSEQQMIPNVPSSSTCASVCLSTPNCTFFVYDGPASQGTGSSQTQGNSNSQGNGNAWGQQNGGQNGNSWGRRALKQSGGNCYLRSSPFTNGDISQDSQKTACISRGPSSGSQPSPANYVCYQNQKVSGTVISQAPSENPMKCTDSCTSTPNCTYSVYMFDGTCILGSSPFTTGDSSDNAVDYDVIQLCLFADGAPDTVIEGYTCFDDALINGDQLTQIPSVTSNDDCVRLCESNSESCTLAVYTAGSQTCGLYTNAFGFGGSGARSAGQTSCLRAASGGSKNSAPNFLCYGSQSISGTVLSSQSAVADTIACSTLCGSTPGCTFATYEASVSATCTLKTDAFYGSEDVSITRSDPSIDVCLAAPFAPQVISSFGVGGDGDSTYGTVSGDF